MQHVCSNGGLHKVPNQVLVFLVRRSILCMPSFGIQSEAARLTERGHVIVVCVFIVIGSEILLELQKLLQRRAPAQHTPQLFTAIPDSIVATGDRLALATFTAVLGSVGVQAESQGSVFLGFALLT